MYGDGVPDWIYNLPPEIQYQAYQDYDAQHRLGTEMFEDYIADRMNEREVYRASYNAAATARTICRDSPHLAPQVGRVLYGGMKAREEGFRKAAQGVSIAHLL